MRGIEPPTSAWKADMLASTPHPHYLELRGFEPLTPCLQGRCSSQLSYNPISNGPDEIRTHDFYLARVALSQLSYKPIIVSNILLTLIRNASAQDTLSCFTLPYYYKLYEFAFTFVIGE